MKINYYSSTDEIIKEIGARIKSSRLDVNITQKAMAERTGLSQRTISNLENGKDVSFKTIIEVLRILNLAQRIDLLVPETGLRPSRIIKDMKTRERASGNAESVSDNTWKWGDE